MNKRATIYFEPELHQALRVKAAHTQRSVSNLVNDAVRQALREDLGPAALSRAAGTVSNHL